MAENVVEAAPRRSLGHNHVSGANSGLYACDALKQRQITHRPCVVVVR